MTSPISSLLKPIQERLDRATPGPWMVDRWDGDEWGYGVRGKGRRTPSAMLFTANNLELPHENAEFIAHAPETVAKLLKCVERMESALKRIDDNKEPDPQWCRDESACALQDVRAILEEGK